MSKKQARTDIFNNEIIELFILGNSQAGIADKLQCSRNLVHYRLKKMDFIKPGQRKAKPCLKQRMCSCCGIRPVPVKPVGGVRLTRLCYPCFRNAESDHDNRDFPATMAI